MTNLTELDLTGSTKKRIETKVDYREIFLESGMRARQAIECQYLLSLAEQHE